MWADGGPRGHGRAPGTVQPAVLLEGIEHDHGYVGGVFVPALPPARVAEWKWPYAHTGAG